MKEFFWNLIDVVLVCLVSIFVSHQFISHPITIEEKSCELSKKENIKEK